MNHRGNSLYEGYSRLLEQAGIDRHLAQARLLSVRLANRAYEFDVPMRSDLN
jgi:hypothetical protein